MANRMLKVIAFAGALAVSAPAFAAKPVVKPAAGKTAEPKWGNPVPIETDCFFMNMPGSLVPTQRVKSANKPYYGTWGFFSAPNANLKVWVRCNPAKKAPIKTVLERGVKKATAWIASMRVTKDGFHYFKDDKGRDVGQVFFSGVTKVLKNKKSVAARHMFSRTTIQFTNKRKMRVSVTVAAAGEYAKDIAEITSAILADLEVVEPADKNAIKNRAKAKQAAAKKRAISKRLK